jgi:hypothetical protein
MNAASGLLSKPAYFLHWGVVQISLANFLVVVAMIVVFALALILPFPHGPRNPHEHSDAQERRDDDERA